MLEVLGTVKINHCRFLHNKHFEGHGTAVYFSSSYSLQKATQQTFTLSNCNFSNNEGTDSIVYIGYGNTYLLIVLTNCVFSGNKGVSLYLSNQILHLLENIIFHNNTQWRRKQKKVGGGSSLSQ